MKKSIQRLSRMGVSFLINKLASVIAVASIALCATSSANADVVEMFKLKGTVGTMFGSTATFNGMLGLDFSDDFSSYQVGSLSLSVGGRPVFNKVSSIGLGGLTGSIHASNSAHDLLTLTFGLKSSGSWDDFEVGGVTGGQLVFGTLNGVLLGAGGTVTRISGPAIDPPVPVASATVPELSTWAMMLLGLAGLGLAAKRRREFRSPASQA
jgi:MYXO-CTERM domain-containing protein